MKTWTQIFHFKSSNLKLKAEQILYTKNEDVIITELLWSNLNRASCQHQDELVTSGLLTSRWGPVQLQKLDTGLDTLHSLVAITPLSVHDKRTNQCFMYMCSLLSIAQIHGKMQHLGCYLSWKSLHVLRRHEGLELEWTCIAEIEKYRWQLAWEILASLLN